jgi:hypothetical protein
LDNLDEKRHVKINSPKDTASASNPVKMRLLAHFLFLADSKVKYNFPPSLSHAAPRGAIKNSNLIKTYAS